jgi:O-antigen/teichoic acid export membrane protein
MDSVVLAAIGIGDSQIGQYAAASKILEASQGLPLVVAAGLFPIAAQLGRTGDRAQLAPFFTQVNRICLLLGAPAAVIAAVISPPVARLLYGPGYGLTGPVLAVLAVAAPVFYSNLVAAHMLLAMGRHWEAALFRGGASILKLALILVVGPKLGALGAAVALLATDLVLFAILFVWRRAQGLSESGEGKLILTCLAASIASLGAWRWSSSAAIWVTLIAVAVPFAAWLGARRLLRPRAVPVPTHDAPAE